MMEKLLVLAVTILTSAAQRPLESYNVDSSAISVSGISAGGCMATQMHVAYSNLIMGCGTVAGVVYYCGEASSVRAIQCMGDNNVDPDFLADEAIRFASEGKIDGTSNMQGSRVFILQGTADNTVDPANANHIRTFYQRFTSSGNIGAETSLNLVHGFPTEDYGTECNVPNLSEYINRCQYHGSYEMLQHFYGGLQRPTTGTPLNGDFYEFDQNEFHVGSMSGISMDSVGFAYIPSGCLNRLTPCKLHVSFHGCNQGRDFIGDTYARNTFYNQVGELNDIIILWPQTIASNLNPANPEGCWDWWGYNDSGVGSTGDYATQNGPQMQAVEKMIQRLMGNF